MTADEVLRILKRRGCTVKPGKGGHLRIVCGKCATVLPMHKGDMRIGTLHAFVRKSNRASGGTGTRSECAMAKSKEYRVVFTPDPDGRWGAEIPGEPGGCLCVTRGRSLRETRTRIRDALATALEDEKAAEAAVFLEEFKLPEARRLKGLRARREKVETSVRELADETRDVARKLHKEGFSLRDIAELVGTSHQRVQQWVAG